MEYRGDRVAHNAVARRRGMQMIADIVDGVEMVWMSRIAQQLVEVDDAVELSLHPDPGVHRLAVRLVGRIRM